MLALSPQRRQTGFSLVEIMVGMVVGLLGIIVIMQMYSQFERQKRTTTSGDEAQNNGAIALYQLQRNLQHSGYGISVLELLGCDVLLRTGVTLTGLAPVTIIPYDINDPLKGDANTDRLLVVYGNSDGTATGDVITSGGGTSYTMRNTPNAAAGDFVLAEPASNACTGADFLTLQQVAVGGIDTTARTITLTSSVSAFDGTLYNLGPAPRILAYAVRSGSLTVCDYMTDNCGDPGNASNTSIWMPLASDIASLRAQYGQDTTGRSPVTAIKTASMDAILDGYSQITPTDSCGWARTPAVRLVLAARGAQRGPQAVTAAPLWSGSSGAPGAPIVLTADTQWQRYHYKVFETTVPLRNVTWMGVQSGC